MIIYDDKQAGKFKEQGVDKIIKILLEEKQKKYDGLYASLQAPFEKYDIKEKADFIVVVGIGGSSLGSKAVLSSLDKTDNIRFLETIDPHGIRKLVSECKNKNFKLIIISKSGGTLETITNAQVIINELRVPKKNIIIITEPESPLQVVAEKEKILFYNQPKNIGGRYSVFSITGLLPVSLAGVNINKLLRGAKQAISDIKTECVASRSAYHLYHNYLSGRNIHETWFFTPRLKIIGDWYRQLLAESIGKENSLDGKKVTVGITPTNSIGTTDLHSVGQLDLGGPDDKFYTFINLRSDLNVTAQTGFLTANHNYISGKSLHKIRQAVFEGTIGAFKKRKRPYEIFTLSSVNEEQIGYFMQLQMIKIMILGLLLNVNAFDQPNVELYKIIAKRQLQ